MSPKVELVVESVELGEGPHWDVETQSLYFVDIFGNSIHRYEPSTKTHKKAVIGSEPVSLIIPVDGQKDKYLITIKRKLATVTWDGISETVSDIKILGEVEDAEDTKDNRFNDGKADPTGRLWFGTMGSEPVLGKVTPNAGALYSFEGGKITKHLGKIGISNGLAWNTALKKFYYIDSPERKVFQFDYDEVTGTISNQETIFTLEKHGIEGFPDGQAIDTDGNLWVAIFNGYRVIKIDPRTPETLLDTIKLPAKQVTSVAFGGPNLDELYVTSAKFTVGGVVLEAKEGHGATFKVTDVGAKGYPGVKVKL